MPTVKIPYESISKMADRASSAAQAVLQVDDGSFYSDSDSLLAQVCLLIPCQRLSTSPSDDSQQQAAVSSTTSVTSPIFN